ncbi:MAG: glycosyltransferase [Thermoproteota archaeon]
MTDTFIGRLEGDKYSKERTNISLPVTRPSVSVVVPAYFSESTIEDCLKSLTSLNYPKEQLEIIVIDSGNDETQNICRKYNVLYYHSTNKLSAGAARNMGAEIAKGQIIAFLDADCIAPHQWIFHLIRDFEEFPEAFGVLGIYEGGKSGLDKVRGGELMRCEKRMGFHYGFIEGNAAFRRKVFDTGCRFGDMTYGECIKISKELVQRGMQTVWDPTLKVFHKGNLTYERMFAKDRAYARISLRLDRGTLAKGILKLLYLTIVLVSLPFWPIVSGALALLLLVGFIVHSLSDKMVSSRHRVRFLPIMIAMRLSKFFASVIETFLHIFGGEFVR